MTDAPHFRGYSIDQLRYQIVLKSLQREYSKDKFFANVKKTVNSTPFGSSGKNKSLLGGSAISLIMKGLGYADYALLGYSAFRTVKNVFSIFRRKKK